MNREQLRDEIIRIAQRLANIKCPCALVDEIGIPVSESVKDLKTIIALLNESGADDNKDDTKEE